MILLHFSEGLQFQHSTLLLSKDSGLWSQSNAETFEARLEMMCASFLDVLNIIISSSLVFCPFEFYINNNIFQWIHCRLPTAESMVSMKVLFSLCYLLIIVFYAIVAIGLSFFPAGGTLSLLTELVIVYFGEIMNNK